MSLDKHIFISEPRSGTRDFNMFTFNEFASLTYENMPFVLAPNLSKILKNKNKNKILGKDKEHTMMSSF